MTPAKEQIQAALDDIEAVSDGFDLREEEIALRLKGPTILTAKHILQSALEQRGKE